MRNRERQRGSTLIEVMCAAAILLVAIVGLVAVMNASASATAIGHRRTVEAHLRRAVVDRIMVMPRDRVETLPQRTWVIASCYDVDARELAAASGTPPRCPDGTRYQTGYYVDPQAAARTWRVLTYAERLTRQEAVCNSDLRFSSVACMGADLLLTD